MSETSNKARLEHDCIGQMEVPANVYWGIHTQRYRQLRSPASPIANILS